MNRNYQKELDNIIAGHGQRREAPTLFLHSCCAPCSSYVLEYLSAFFRITVFYYNPNIYPAEEYEKRVAELEKELETVRAKQAAESKKQIDKVEESGE